MPRYVYTDASFADGVAAIAVVGALGTHVRCILAANSTTAEHEAMRWAFELARQSDHGRGELVFRTDCKSTAKAFTAPVARGWRTEVVPRAQNVVAHGVASRARREDERRAPERAARWAARTAPRVRLRP
jgi:hypothetical protein